MLEHQAEHLEKLACIVIDQGLQADAGAPKFDGPGRKNMVTPPPPMTHTFPKRPFLENFKKL